MSPAGTAKLAECELVPSVEIGKHTSELQSPTNLVCRLLLEKNSSRLALQAALLGRIHETSPARIQTRILARIQMPYVVSVFFLLTRGPPDPQNFPYSPLSG